MLFAFSSHLFSHCYFLVCFSGLLGLYLFASVCVCLSVFVCQCLYICVCLLRFALHVVEARARPHHRHDLGLGLLVQSEKRTAAARPMRGRQVPWAEAGAEPWGMEARRESEGESEEERGVLKASEMGGLVQLQHGMAQPGWGGRWVLSIIICFPRWLKSHDILPADCWIRWGWWQHLKANQLQSIRRVRERVYDRIIWGVM